MTSAKATVSTFQNIVNLPGGPQAAMLALPRSGNWDFNVVPNTPPTGTVLLWTAGATHSAVVAAPNQIRGYNQVAQFPTINNAGLTTGTPNQLGIPNRQVHTIAEQTIVQAAGHANL